MNFNNNTNIGCGMIVAIFIGSVCMSYLFTTGIVWVICQLLSGYGIVFDIKAATAIWLVLFLVGGVIGGKAKIEFD